VALDQPCHSAYEKFIEITNPLRGEALSAETPSEVEAYLEEDGRELRRRRQEHLASRGSGRVGEAVCGADGVVRPPKRDHLERSYQRVFGRVQVERTGYGQRGVASLFPRDAPLNLPTQGYSHRLPKRACRYVVKDRLETTGAHWGLEGGEAVLKLRALYLNGDFEAYWTFHEQQEDQRHHQAKFAEMPKVRPRLPLIPTGRG